MGEIGQKMPRGSFPRSRPSCHGNSASPFRLGRRRRAVKLLHSGSQILAGFHSSDQRARLSFRAHDPAAADPDDCQIQSVYAPRPPRPSAPAIATAIWDPRQCPVPCQPQVSAGAAR